MFLVEGKPKLEVGGPLLLSLLLRMFEEGTNLDEETEPEQVVVMFGWWYMRYQVQVNCTLTIQEYMPAVTATTTRLLGPRWS